MERFRQISAEKKYPMNKKQLVTFLDWLTNIKKTEPLVLETEPDDIAEMYLQTKESKNDVACCYEILNYFNKKTNKHYKHLHYAHNLIQERLDEGFAVEDFYFVSDKKIAEWTGTEYEEFLRPSTLFSEKNFENYLNSYGTHRSKIKSNSGAAAEAVAAAKNRINKIR